MGLISADGRLLAEERRHAEPGEPLPDLFRHVREDVDRLVSGQGLEYPPSGGIGIGAAAIVDHRTGWLKLAGNLKWENCNLRGVAESVLQCPVAVECDSNAGALADFYWGHAQGAENLLYITWGTGIGAGLVLNRRLYHSRGCSMGEFGHTRVEWQDPRPCYCGCHGCLETEASGLAMEERMSAQLGRTITVREIAQRAAAGDAACREVLERSARLLARALSGVLPLLNPDHIVIGGGVSHCMALIQSALLDELRVLTPAFALRDLTVTMSDFPDTAGLLGAALLPRHEAEAGSATQRDGAVPDVAPPAGAEHQRIRER